MHRLHTSYLSSNVSATRTTILGLLALGTVVLSSGCMHSQFERSGRDALYTRAVPAAKFFAKKPRGFRKNGVIRTKAMAMASPERLRKHLMFRAGSLGCDAVSDLKMGEKSATAYCLKDHRSTLQSPIDTLIARRASDIEMRDLLTQGEAGIHMASFLKRYNQLSSLEERRWQLRWYRQKYPNSPYLHILEQLRTKDTGGDRINAGAAASLAR